MNWLSWPFRMLFFLLWFAREIVVSSAAVMRDNLTPGQSSTPGIVCLHTRCRTDAEVTLLGALITLTPGTLTLGANRHYADDERVIFVHGMYAADAEELRAELQEMETRMLRALRRDPRAVPAPEPGPKAHGGYGPSSRPQEGDDAARAASRGKERG